ncbi:hypothetical protein [Devosia sp. A449]
MLTSIFLAIAQNVLLGWLWRRLQELVAFTAGLAPLFLMLPPEHQALIVAVLQGQGGGYSISAYAGFAMYLWSQWQSYRATVRPQVVTVEGKKLPLTPTGSKEAEAVARLAPAPRTLWDRLTSR